MIKLEMQYDEPPEKRVINGVMFEDGKATLPDSYRAKAEAICRYYNVEMVFEFRQSEVDDAANNVLESIANGADVTVIDDEVAEVEDVVEPEDEPEE